jgi:hypothetical protein
MAAVSFKKGAVYQASRKTGNGGFDFSKPPLGYRFLIAARNVCHNCGFFICYR